VWPEETRIYLLSEEKNGADGNSSMNRPAVVQTTQGGDAMEPQEITLGQVTYEVRRVFQGGQTIPELIVERLTQNFPASPPVDRGDAHAL